MTVHMVVQRVTGVVCVHSSLQQAYAWMHALALQKPALLFHACSGAAIQFQPVSSDGVRG